MSKRIVYERSPFSNRNTYLDGYRRAILDLRELQDKFFHVSKWSSSKKLTFAPVELSDYLVSWKYEKLRKQVNGGI